MKSASSGRKLEAQFSMFTFKETPPRYTTFALSQSTFEDVSFTSYLMKPKDIAQISQNESRLISIDDTELSIFDARRYFSGSNDRKEVEKEQQKLQDTCNDFVTNDQRVPPSPVSSVDGYGGNFPGARSSSATTATASVSEASWNSRTGLLMANAKGVSLKSTFPSNDGKIKRTFAAKKWLLDRKSNCCIGKKAVRVKEVELESENTEPDSIKTGKNVDDEDKYLPSHSHDFLKNHQQKKLLQENNLESTQETLKQRVSAKGRPFIDELRLLSFPVNVNSNSIRVKDKNMGRKSNASTLEDSPRKSLEVFRALLDLSSVLGPKNLVRDRALFDPGSPIVGVTNVDDDAGSDASSDLFEIESLSAPTSSNSMYRRRDYSVREENPTFDARRYTISAHGVNVTRKVEFDMKSLDESRAASERTYLPAPSEVSIDWSVATAEGLEKASVTTNISAASASEIGRADISGQRPQPQKQEELGGVHGGWRKGNGLLLMGCREDKAVSVGPHPVVKRVALGQRILP